MLEQVKSMLEELASLEENFFKSRAYRNANLSLNGLSEAEFISRDDFTDLDGIGAAINEKLLEFKETGKITKLENLRKESKDYLDTTLYKVRDSFITKRIPFKEALKYVEEVKNTIKVNFFEVAGSYRRKKSLIGDIDVIVDESSYPNAVEILSNKFEVISSGSYKSSFMIDPVNNIQLDLIATTKEQLPFQLLYLTGSKEFNIRMRSIAKSKGYRLNQEGLFDLDTEECIENLNNEKEVFKFLGMAYVVPELR